MINDLLTIAVSVQDLLNRLGIPYCFIGGLAVQRWGEPRVTRDVDLTLLTRYERESEIINELLKHFKPRIDDAVNFALINRVLLLKSDSDVGIDMALGGLPFEEHAVENSSFYEYADGISLRTISANDLIVMKAFAARPRDWNDIEGILIRSKSQLDFQYIMDQITPLAELKEELAIITKLKLIFAR